MSDHVHIDPVSGVAGDMMLGAVLDAGVPLVELLGPLATLGLSNWSIEAVKDRRLGLGGTRAQVLVHGEDAGAAWHSSDHGHARVGDLVATVRGADGLPAEVRERAERAFVLLGEAEGAAHGRSPENTHLHEVGSIDAVVDLCGGLLGLHLLGASSISCGPVPLGSGTVRCAHGVMPVPVPAVASLLAGVPSVPGAGAHPTGELSTPTGVALLRACVDDFGAPPPMTLRVVGVGLGARERVDVPNILRLFVGECARGRTPEAQSVQVLSTTLDDLDGRIVPDVIARLMGAGALDVLVVPAHGKKGRPALLFEVIAPDDTTREHLAKLLFRETPTLGVRWRLEQRATLARRHRSVQTPFGAVRIKEGSLDGEVLTRQPELDDCIKLARRAEVPLRAVLAAASAAAHSGNPD